MGNCTSHPKQNNIYVEEYKKSRVQRIVDLYYDKPLIKRDVQS